jgi:hypothetical protein
VIGFVVKYAVQDATIKTVPGFKCLARILSNNDSDEPTVNRNRNWNWNLKRARSTLGRIGRILSREGARPKAMPTLYKSAVQSVLLYGSESWGSSTVPITCRYIHNRFRSRWDSGEWGAWNHEPLIIDSLCYCSILNVKMLGML